MAQFIRTKGAAVHGIQSLLLLNIPARFPKLRFGCIEAGATWAPLVDYDLRRRLRTRPGAPNIFGAPNTDLPANLFRENRIYITCQVDEDLPYLLKYVGEDNLMIGSDYTHRDPSNEHGFHALLQERATRGEIPQAAVQKILYDNPRAFYGL